MTLTPHDRERNAATQCPENWLLWVLVKRYGDVEAVRRREL